MLEKLESTMYLILVYIEVVWRSKGILYIWTIIWKILLV